MEEKSQIQIPLVKLGSQGLEVSRLGYGCGELSGIYRGDKVTLTHGCAIIKEAFNRGITFFDTSDSYGLKHHNELLLGEALKQLPRERVQLATKFGVVMSGDYQFQVNGTPEYVRECCEASLKRLDVSYIDLYYQHRVDISVPIEDTMRELKKLLNEGKIRYIGLSEASADTITRAHAVHPITAVQMEYSLWSRETENDIIPLCWKLGIGIVSYSPLGRGFFGGKAMLESLPEESLLICYFTYIQVYRHRFNGKNLEKNKLLYSKFASLATKYACTAPQLALAWLLHQDNYIIPIPATTRVKNLDINIGSLDVKLTEEDLKEIAEAVPVDEVGGDREFEFLAKYAWNYANTPSK